MRSINNNNKNTEKRMGSSCEHCEFYDFDDEIEQYVCCMSLDEDEMAAFIGHRTGNCPYFRFYDEYKSVQKQN